MAKKTTAPAALAQKHGKPLITGRILQQIYTTLRECTMLADYAGTAPARNFAALAAIAAVLRREDLVASAVESATTFFALGAGLDSPGLQKNKPEWKRILPADWAMATGAAAVLQRRIPGASMIAFSDGLRLDSGALHYAWLHKLPIVYVRHGGKEKEPPPEIEFPAIPVDQEDAVAIYRVVFESIARARHGGGPTLLECRPYPLQAHGALLTMERYLAGKGLFSNRWKRQVEARFAEQLKAMRPEDRIAFKTKSAAR